MIPMILIFLGFAWLLFSLALWQKNAWLGFLSGAFICVIGVYSWIYGIGDMNDTLLMQAFATIHAGIGSTIMVIAGIEQLQSL